MGQGDAVRSQVRGSSLLLTGRVLAAALNLLVQVLVVRSLTKSGYGAFAYALAIAGVGEVVALVGSRHAVSRFVPLYEERGEPAHSAGTVVAAGVTVVAAGTAFVLVVVAFGGIVGGNVADDARAMQVLFILALLAPIMSFENLLDALYATFSRPVAIFLRQYVMVPGLRLVAVLIVLLGPRDPVVLAAGYVIAGGLGVVIAFWMLWRILTRAGTLPSWRRAGIRVPLRELALFALPLFADDLSSLLIDAADALMLGQLGTAEQVANLRAVLPIARANQYVEYSFGLLFVPLAARRFANGDHEGVSDAYWRTTMWSAVLAFPIVATTVALADPVTVLVFGERYRTSAPLLTVLSVGYYLYAVTGPNRSLLAVYGRVREILTVNVVAVATNVGLNLWLIPRIGAMGAAIGTLVTLGLRSAVLQVVVHLRTGVPGIVREVVPVAGVIGAMLAALFAFRADVVGLPAALTATVVASVGVLAVARRRLRLMDTFPELARIPGLRRLLDDDDGEGDRASGS